MPDIVYMHAQYYRCTVVLHVICNCNFKNKKDMIHLCKYCRVKHKSD